MGVCAVCDDSQVASSPPRRKDSLKLECSLSGPGLEIVCAVGHGRPHTGMDTGDTHHANFSSRVDLQLMETIKQPFSRH